DVKDQRWLARYEAKLNAPQAEDGVQAADGAATDASQLDADAQADAIANANADASIEPDPEFSSEIETLSDDLQSDNRLAEGDDDIEGD
ncbi:hypothetical protein NY407_10960, partial [Enterobacter hormaechei]|uniref:hypothetical protein n=1 Tax=Enterobacter hormaechei TaxID=158836 RepID=UPI0022F0BCB3